MESLFLIKMHSLRESVTQQKQIVLAQSDCVKQSHVW